MTFLPFVLILFSGLMHALYNLLIKRSGNKTVFIWWLFLASSALCTLMLPLLPGPFPRPDFPVLFLGAGGGFCFVLYHLLTARAYHSGDLSLTYPLSQTATLYLPLWGVWLLGEQLTATGLCGILLVAAGAYLVQLQRLTVGEVVRPLCSLADRPVQAALAAGFVYSLGAIVDKTGVRLYPPFYFTYILVLSMLALMTANLLRPRYRSLILAEWRQNRRYIITGGPLMMGSFLSFRYGLSLSPLSYAIPVRQSSVLMGVLFGIVFLGESCGRIRVGAALLILAGVCLIRVG